jgi:hypothetical protein
MAIRLGGAGAPAGGATGAGAGAPAGAGGATGGGPWAHQGQSAQAPRGPQSSCQPAPRQAPHVCMQRGAPLQAAQKGLALAASICIISISYFKKLRASPPQSES